MVSCDALGADPEDCVPVCDPSIEDCPIEAPTGPSYEDALVVGVFFASETQVFVANLRVILAVIAFITAECLEGFVVKRSDGYV